MSFAQTANDACRAEDSSVRPQFHILALARDIHTLVKAQAELEIKRPQKRIWWPRISFSVPRYFHASTEQNEDPDGQDEAGLDSDPGKPKLLRLT